MIGALSGFCKLLAGLVSKASDDVVIDQSCCLHVCIHYGAADKLESALFEIFAQSIRLGRGGRNVRIVSMTVLNGRAVNKSPDVVAEAAELLLHCEERFGVGDCGPYLQSIPHDTRIQQQLLDPSFCETCNFLWVEVGESLSIAFALVQYR